MPFVNRFRLNLLRFYWASLIHPQLLLLMLFTLRAVILTATDSDDRRVLLDHRVGAYVRNFFVLPLLTASLLSFLLMPRSVLAYLCSNSFRLMFEQLGWGLRPLGIALYISLMLLAIGSAANNLLSHFGPDSPPLAPLTAAFATTVLFLRTFIDPCLNLSATGLLSLDVMLLPALPMRDMLRNAWPTENS